jgi:hypothetical protein
VNLSISVEREIVGLQVEEGVDDELRGSMEVMKGTRGGSLVVVELEL